MRTSERVLLGLATGLLAVAVVLCGYQASAPQNFNFTENNIPTSVILAYLAGLLAAPFALVGLASAAGMLFLRAARWTWTAPEDFDEPVTPES
jgi:hypothetical protein